MSTLVLFCMEWNGDAEFLLNLVGSVGKLAALRLWNMASRSTNMVTVDVWIFGRLSEGSFGYIDALILV